MKFTYCATQVSDIIKIMPLSNNTVQGRIDEMAQDVEDSLCEYIKAFRFPIYLFLFSKSTS